MFVRGLLACVLLSAVPLTGQIAPSAVAPVAQADGTPRDRNDARFQQLQQELRERDAIIRNLMTRVQELERRVGTAPQMGARAPDSVNAILPNSATPTAVANDNGYNEEDRKARA